MEIIQEQEALAILAELNVRNMLVPIIGAGFSGGAKASNGQVPMCDELKEIMVTKIIANSQILNKEDLKNMSFEETSELFLDEKIVPIEVRQEVFEKYFTNVNLPDYKKEFLQLWNYIYTINIDDAIERATNYTVIHPYTSLRDNFGNILKKNSYVLKLHGDANREILVSGNQNIVFKSSQYISCMNSEYNAQLIKSIKSDYEQKNIIFIGCSLNKEPDLQSIYESTCANIVNRKIFYLSNTIPDKIKEIKLRRYGITTIVLVNNYNAFIKNLKDAIILCKESCEDELYKYINPKIEKIKERDSILEILSYGKSIFNTKNNSFEIPTCFVMRNILNGIIEEINKIGIVVIKGRRLSGKTMLLASLIQRMPSMHSVYFPSDVQVDEFTVKNMLINRNNTLFIFDSNSYSPETYQIILSCISECKMRENCIVIASSTNEDNLIYKTGASSFNLPNILDNIELEELNNKVDKYAFVHRSNGDSSLDYSFKIMKQFDKELKIANFKIESMSIKQKIILYMLAVFDKLYYHEAIQLDIQINDIKSFTKEYPVLFEISNCEPSESKGKSVYKLVHNSKVLLFELIYNMKINDIAEVIQRIVKKLYLIDREQYKAVMMFDTLNQLLSRDGAASHIEYIYNKLENDLCHEPHFWLQRAKSIYRLFKTDEKKLEIARQYATKSYEDSEKHSSLKMKSMFTLSLICGLLFNLEKDIKKKDELMFFSIKYAYRSLFSNDYIFDSIRNEIFTLRSNNSSFYKMLLNICNICIHNHPQNIEMSCMATKLKHNLINIKR